MSAIRVDALGPFHHAAALAMLSAHAIPGAEEVDGATYRRILSIGGEPVIVRITLDAGGVTAIADDAAALGDPELAVGLIRRWFDLDADTDLIDRTLAGDPVMAPLTARRPGLRLIGHPDEFEAFSSTVIGQQVSLAAARTFASRLVAPRRCSRRPAHLPRRRHRRAAWASSKPARGRSTRCPGAGPAAPFCAA